MGILAERHTVCEHCLAPITGTLYTTATRVFLKKHCAKCGENEDNGTTRTLISSDPAYFLRSWIGAHAKSPPKGFSALVVEVTDDCNFRCPTCIASSEPGAGNTKRLSTIEKMISAAESSVRKPDILMISGGEPTIHPKIIEILQLACASSIGHVILITNGKRIADETSFVQALAALPKKFEVYLQFDSLEPNVLKDLRGEDFSGVRRKAVASLCAHQIPTTLVCVVKQGLNDHLCGDVIRYALSFTNIKGVTFQPIKASGRTDSLTHRDQIIDLALVRNKLVEAHIGFKREDLVPHPMNPENICTGYLSRATNDFKTVTNLVCGNNERLSPLKNCMFFLPKHDSLKLKYDSLFRVMIISFMDKYNFSQELLPYSPIGFVTSHGAIVPMDTYYMFGRTK
jgi:uncharacterized radical SAM superfamily Fe-S cluster-containing enzyme